MSSDPPPPNLIERSPHPERGSQSFWLRAALGLGGALATQELTSDWGSHLKSTDLYPLSIAVGMILYNAHLLRIIPPQDPKSRLRALWLPEQKRQALGVALILMITSIIYTGIRLNRPVAQITPHDLQALRPISRGWHILSGTPRQSDRDHYRWALAHQETHHHDPHLTSLKEFKGQVLVISDEALNEPLVNRRGWLTEVSPLAEIHYVSYRKYMGLSSQTTIYLFDLRGRWWFDPYSFSAILTSLFLVILVIGSATRDPENQSRRIFIPPEFRNHLEDDPDEEVVIDHQQEVVVEQRTPEDPDVPES